MSKYLHIKVSNIHPSTTEDELEALFADFGDVDELFLNEEPDPGKRTYTAFVTMESKSEAEEAFAELKGEWVDGNQISLSWYNADDEEEDFDDDDEETDEGDFPDDFENLGDDWDEDDEDSWKDKKKWN
jgi:RNA recognition motif-containing protein